MIWFSNMYSSNKIIFVIFPFASFLDLFSMNCLISRVAQQQNISIALSMLRITNRAHTQTRAAEVKAIQKKKEILKEFYRPKSTVKLWFPWNVSILSVSLVCTVHAHKHDVNNIAVSHLFESVFVWQFNDGKKKIILCFSSSFDFSTSTTK